MITLATGQILVADFTDRAHRILPCDAVNDPHPTKAKTQAAGIGAPWNLYVTLTFERSENHFAND
jgi:hypothetical protein